MATRTPTRGYCMGVASTVKAMMVQIDSPLAVTSLTFDQPFTFHCTEVDTLNKRLLREVPVNFKAGRTLYFVASADMPGWYFILMYAQNEIGCSCKKDRCSHKEMLQQSAIAA